MGSAPVSFTSEASLDVSRAATATRIASFANRRASEAERPLPAPTMSAVSGCFIAPVPALAAGFHVLVEELLHGLEELHAVLLHDHRVRALADLDITLVRGVDELGEVGVEHVARQILVPFGMGEESRNADLRRIVERLARAPVLAAVLLHAIGRAQHRRGLFFGGRGARQRRLRPGLRPARRDPIRVLLLRPTPPPAGPRPRPWHLAVVAA